VVTVPLQGGQKWGFVQAALCRRLCFWLNISNKIHWQ